jgi:hypothetical protein
MTIDNQNVGLRRIKAATADVAIRRFCRLVSQSPRLPYFEEQQASN